MAVLDFLAPFDIGVFSSYACSDAGAFSGNINPSEKIAVMNRLVRASDRNAKGAGAAAGFQVGHNWNANQLKTVYEAVTKERYGECTTFAKAIAHLITQGEGNKPRIEIASYVNHVFLIVGRVGGYTDIGQGFRKKRRIFASDADTTAGIISDIQFGGDWALVDGWAGAMGYPDIIYTKVGTRLQGANSGQDFPFPEMLNPTDLVMERPAGP